MSENVSTKKQLDSLQQHIRYLQKLNDAKDKKIKTLLEVPQRENSAASTKDLNKERKKLENEINELRILNEELKNAINTSKISDNKIKELELLLNEERKLREYSESFAEQVELKCAEEALIRDLTSQLCHLQKSEIEIESKQILDLQRKNEELKKEMEKMIVERKKEDENSRAATDNEEKFLRDIHDIRDIMLQSKNILGQNLTLFDTSDEQQEDSWLGEINKVVDNLNDIKEIKKDLIFLKGEIENKKKKSLSK